MIQIASTPISVDGGSAKYNETVLGTRAKELDGDRGGRTTTATAGEKPEGARRSRADPFDVDEVDDLEALGEHIATLSAHIHAATHQLLVLIAEFDRRRGWEVDGHRSCAHWLAFRTGIERVTAREKVRVAHALRNLPQIDEAMSRGELSFAKVRALTRTATAGTEGELLAFARDTTAAQLEQTLRSMKLLSRKDEVERERERHRWRSFSVFPDGTGMYEVRGRLDPEVAAVLMRAVDAAGDALYTSTNWAEEVEPQQRRADALGLMAERALAAGFGEVTVEVGHDCGSEDGHRCRSEDASAEAPGARATAKATESRSAAAEMLGVPATPGASESRMTPARVHHIPQTTEANDPSSAATEAHGSPTDSETRGSEDASAEASRPMLSCSRAERYQVVLHVDRDTLRSGVESGRSELMDGTRLSPETSRRLSCDAGVVRVTRGRDGAILDVGRRTRTIPPALRRALEIRDGGCRFPGCGSRFVEAHHVVHWADGGKTSLANCCLLCRLHHRLVHEEGYTIDFPPGGDPTFYTPRRLPVPDKPPRLPEATLEALVRANQRRGVLPDGWTCTARYEREADIPWPVLARMLEAIDS